MPRVASIIPPEGKGSARSCDGTKVLLDNGEYLQHVNKITLLAEPGQPWKAVIEVHPTNQEQIDALLADLEVVKRNDAFNRLHEIQKEMQHLQDEKLFLEHKYLSGVTGVSTDGVKNVPKEDTWLLKEGEKILPVTGKVKDFYGAIHSFPDLKGDQDDSEEHY
ncbi:hypothetical protein NRA37_06780 [Acinetobacter baumannii]|nr:hypothetical protein [Acinetobacter baumannii]